MVKQSLRYVLTVLCVVLVFSVMTDGPQPLEAYSITSPGGGAPLTDGFTYQGYLEYKGIPANGFYDFRISVWTAATLGTELGYSQSLAGQYVDNGIFSFNIYMNNSNQYVFDGGGRWIEVQVRKDPSDPWTIMARQPITAVPYAWSLRPGAKITGSMNDVIFEVENTYSGGTLGGAIMATGSSPTAPAISGYHTGDGPGIYGGASGAYPAIDGIHSGSGDGVGGYAVDGAGVSGTASDVSGYGVVGMQNGAYREQNNYLRSGGIFGGRNGVIGMTNYNGGYAVVGRSMLTSDNYAWAGHFYNYYGHGVYIYAGTGKTALEIANGNIVTSVPTSEGARELYSQESTEVTVTDYGFGELAGGEALIDIDPTFAQTVNLEEPYHVFVEVYGDADVYVTDRTAESFRVVLRDGADDVEFSYRIVATRLGFEGQRLERADDASALMQNPESTAEQQQ